MDHHTLAALSITGTCLDVLGSLYLAYDLLGGQHGPLRVLTRAVTYSLVFGIGYGLGLGVFFNRSHIVDRVEPRSARLGTLLSGMGGPFFRHSRICFWRGALQGS